MQVQVCIPDEVRRSTNQYRERLYKEVNEFRKMEKEQDSMQSKANGRTPGQGRGRSPQQGGYGGGGGMGQGRQPNQNTARRNDEPLANRGAGGAQPVGVS